MAIKGMDVEGGTQAAQAFARGAQEIEQFGAQYTQVMNGWEWTGADAERIRQTWEDQHMNNLRQVSQALEGFSQLINQQAQEQEQVSS
ncbi:hypothetical protein [Nocardioides sp.]|uniref:hypothetical protein n=1 Tax=Nocardioides sp. TaxID=35761 RepID=UPI002BBA1B11|nr:hypothetical protein [Nocardioides sp.]HXH79859.1 hypothetical protein [Nocardioides sp.]